MDVTQDQIDALYDLEVRSVDGDRLGRVRQVYLDDATGLPAWISVHTGWFGHREHPVPLAGVERTEDELRVAVSGDEVREAPTIEPDEHLSPETVEQLRRHYALGVGEELASQPGDEASPEGPVVEASPEGPGGEGVWREDGSDVVGDGTLRPEQAVTGASLNILREGSDDLARPEPAPRHEGH